MKEEQAAHVAFVQMVLSSPQVATGCVNSANQTIKQYVPSKADVCMGEEKKLMQKKSKRNSNFHKQTTHTRTHTHTSPRLAVTLASQQHWS